MQYERSRFDKLLSKALLEVKVIDSVKLWIWLLLTVTIYLSKISIKNPMHQCIHIMTFLCKRCNKSIKKDKQSACNCGAPYWLHCQNYRCLRAQILESIFILQEKYFNWNWSFKYWFFVDYYQKEISGYKSNRYITIR